MLSYTKAICKILFPSFSQSYIFAFVVTFRCALLSFIPLLKICVQYFNETEIIILFLHAACLRRGHNFYYVT